MNIKRLNIRVLLIALVAMLVTATVSLSTVHADAYTWSSDAVMTLTSDGVEIQPEKVYDGSDGVRKMKIYTIQGDKSYTLTTSENNDYAVLFKVADTRKYSEWGDFTGTKDINVTFDNVTIKTKNPIQTDVNTGGIYAAAMFCGVESDTSGNIRIHLKGTNTIELLGVKDDVAANKWAAMAFEKCTQVIQHQKNEAAATLKLKIDLPAARGEVAALRSNGSVGDPNDNKVDDGVTTLDVYASATHADTGKKYGDGIVAAAEYAGVKLGVQVKANIVAESRGIVFNRAFQDFELYGPELYIRAGEIGILSTSGTVSIGLRDGYVCAITGLASENGEYGYVERGIQSSSTVYFRAGTADIKARREAIYIEGDPEGKKDTDLWISGNNKALATLTVEGSIDDPDCYAIHVPFVKNSGISIADNAKLTVNAGYRAVYAGSHYYSGTVSINTTKPLEGGALYVGSRATIYGFHDTYGTNDFYAKFDANVASDYLAEESSLAYFYIGSNDVAIHAKKAAIRNTVGIDSKYYNTPIVTYQSDDGSTWYPFGQRCSKPYLTTRTPETHVCANDNRYSYTHVADTETHSAKCLACDKTFTEPCDYEYSSSTPPTASEVGYHYYWCKICNESKVVEIPAHDCSLQESVWTDNGETHSGKCTFTGCELEITAAHIYGEWTFPSPLIKERVCIVCNHKDTEETHKNVTHIEPRAATCTAIGTKEAWYCGEEGCECFYSNRELTVKAVIGDLLLPKLHHNYQNGTCTVCGVTGGTMTFIFEEIEYYSDAMTGRKYIAVAKAGDKTYAMGKTANADGSRAAVEVTVQPNGTIDIIPNNVEVFTFEYGSSSPTTFLADGGYMAVVDNKIVVFEKQYAGLGLPEPIRAHNDRDYENDGFTGVLYSELSESPWTKSYIVLDAQTLTFKPAASEEDGSVLMYREVCGHDGDALYHQPAVAPTCIEQGTKEFWYCRECNEYYMNGDMEAPVDTDRYLPYSLQEVLTIDALGHSYDAKGVCEHCGMKRPVFTQVSTLDALKAMPVGTSYIVVIKAGEKTYAMFLPPENIYLKDRDRNHVPDILENDLDENGVPNGIKVFDLDQNGTQDYLEDLNRDGKVDIEDWTTLCIDGLARALEEKIAATPNFFEVTVREDGSIVLADDRQSSAFHLYPSGPWGRIGDEFNGGMMRMMSLDSEEKPFADEPFAGDPSAIDNSSENWWAMFVPNNWVYHGGLLGHYGPTHLSFVPRAYGDYLFPGVIDHHNWYIEFNADGTACMVTGYENELYRDGALQFVQYTHEGKTIQTIVGLSPTFIPNFTIDSSLPVYLYASVPVYEQTQTVQNENYLASITVPIGSNAILTTNTFVAVDDVTDKVTEQAKARVEIVSGAGAQVLASYDISLLRNGATYQPGGKVEVTLPLPKGVDAFTQFTVVYIDEDDNVTPCETRINEDGTITFVTDHFSQYAIVGMPRATRNGSPVVWIVLAAAVPVMAAAAVAFILIKKKKQA